MIFFRMGGCCMIVFWNCDECLLFCFDVVENQDESLFFYNSWLIFTSSCFAYMCIDRNFL